MNIQYKLHYVWFVFFCIIILSCKKKDEEEPSLNIITPLAGQKFSYTPSIDISGNISDNTGLQAIEVSLLDNQYKTISGVVRYPIDKNARSFSVLYEITDVYLPQGNYFIKVQAIDVANNRKSAFVQIYLDELPLSLRGVYYVGTNETNNYNSYLYELGKNTPKLTLDRKTTDIRFYPKYNYLYTCSALGSTFKGYKLNDTLLPLGFQHYQPNASGWDSYTQMLFLSDKTVLLVSKSQPYFQIFGRAGNLIGSHSNSTDFPVQVCELNERIYALVPGTSVAYNQIDVFNPYSNYTKINSKNLTEKVLDIATNGTEICVLTRDSTHSYTRYFRKDDLVQVSNNRHYNIRAKKWYIFNNEAYIITDTGILKENLLSKTASTALWITGNYTALGYEPLSNIVYVANSTHIQAVQAGTGIVLQTYSLPSNIKVEKIDFWYNK
jgi:hypothetical protein